MIAHCELMGDRVAILDPPPSLNAQQIHEWRVEKAGYDSKYATLYWPWIKVFDPASGQTAFVPPSGHMAGVWGRSDDTRGVHKAPANEVVRGALALETTITKGEHDLLNPDGINCIRAFPGRGIRVWGARTLSSDPSWRYLNVRRLFNYIEESILERDPVGRLRAERPRPVAAHPPHHQRVPARVWRDGALFGATPEEAFYVKCDAETNPPEVVDAGQVIVEIGIAPVKPAEFVVFRLAQFSGGAASSSDDRISHPFRLSQGVTRARPTTPVKTFSRTSPSRSRSTASRSRSSRRSRACRREIATIEHQANKPGASAC